jgi:hypothetical protein
MALQVMEHRGGAGDEACPSRTRLTGTVVGQTEVEPEVCDRLYDLFRQYYLYVDRQTFDRDQAEKDWVLLLYDGAGRVRGFTTLKLYELEVHGRPLRAVFSGNTIIDREFWGGQELVATWCRFMAELKRQAVTVPLYWFLVCSGYRTYLYLPLFFREFYPRYHRETLEFEQALIDALGGMKFPGEYDGGVVRVRRPRECLRPELAEPRPTKLSNPHVRFFFESNPGYCHGDELVCLTEFSLANTRRLAQTPALEVLG